MRVEVDPARGIDGVDLELGMRRLGDRALYAKLLLLFARTWSDAAVRIGAALEGEGPLAAAEVAHALRGVAANLALTRIAAISGELEGALGREVSRNDVAEKLGELAEETARVVAAIALSLGTGGHATEESE